MNVKLEKFKQPTIEETVGQLSDHMPQGHAWESKLIEDSGLHTQMHGTSKPFNITQGRISDLSLDFDILQTFELLTDWERSVGLPDDCTGQVSDLDERRILVKDRLARKPIVTPQEQQALINELFPDEGILLIPGVVFAQSFEYEFEFTFFSDINARFIIVISVPAQEPFFEYDFEFDLTGGLKPDILLCVMERMTPANVLPLIVEREPE